MPKKFAEYPKEIVAEAKARRMRPEDYLHQLEECEQAELRMVEIDRKKLKEMQPEEEPVTD